MQIFLPEKVLVPLKKIRENYFIPDNVAPQNSVIPAHTEQQITANCMVNVFSLQTLFRLACSETRIRRVRQIT